MSTDSRNLVPIACGFQERGIPVIYVDRFHADMPGDIVIADDLEGSQRCVRHLVASGRRRIATITGPLQLSNARARLEGYRRALWKGFNLKNG